MAELLSQVKIDTNQNRKEITQYGGTAQCGRSAQLGRTAEHGGSRAQTGGNGGAGPPQHGVNTFRWIENYRDYREFPFTKSLGFISDSHDPTCCLYDIMSMQAKNGATLL